MTRNLGAEGLVVDGELAGGLEVTLQRLQAAVDLDHRGQLGVALPQGARPGLVAVDGRVGELDLEPRVLIEQLGRRLEHG